MNEFEGMTYKQIMEKLLPGFRTPNWDDIAAFWNRSPVEKRIEYITEALECTEDDEFVQAAIKKKWNSLPECFRQQIADCTNMENDVYEEVNREANDKLNEVPNE